MLVGMTVGEREVGRVVRHRMALGSNSDTGIGDGEVGIHHLRHSNILDRIPFSLGACCIQCILEFHIRIQRIVLRRSLLLGHTII